MYIFEFVKQRRKELNLTQKELAEKAKVSHSVVKRFEAQRPYNPKIGKVIQVAKALNVKTDELIDLEWL